MNESFTPGLNEQYVEALQAAVAANQAAKAARKSSVAKRIGLGLLGAAALGGLGYLAYRRYASGEGITVNVSIASDLLPSGPVSQ